MTPQERITRLQDLIEAIAFFRDHPDVPLPYVFESAHILSSYVPNTTTKEEYALLARRNGYRFKGASDFSFSLTQKLGNLTLALVIAREKACTKIITGTRVVPAYTVPEESIEDYEWKCEPLLEKIIETQNEAI